MCLAVFLSMIVAEPLKSLAGLALLSAGIPVYAIWSAHMKRRS
jgi:hypothetical protein